MIFDAENMFSDSDGRTPYSGIRTIAGGPYWFPNAIDLGLPGTPPMSNALAPDFGKGNPLFPLIKVIQAFVGAGGTVTIDLCNDDNWDDTTGMASPAVVATTGAVPVASLSAGAELMMHSLPRGITQQYLALRATVATTNMSAGSMIAGLPAAIQTNRSGI